AIGNPARPLGACPFQATAYHNNSATKLKLIGSPTVERRLAITSAKVLEEGSHGRARTSVFTTSN
ncbi:hypothetical protein, partial [Bradyrhizobium sp.]|uniref:hypothetical protein n=1 Tax=Bradyrhizobium sp. TaxID=376 RepID=UPI00290774C5